MADKPDPPGFAKLSSPFALSMLRASPYRTILGGLLEPPPVIQDRWFKDTTVHLDGYTFERCRFDRCQLATENATFVFRQCVISPDCRFVFQGPALKIARLLMHGLAVKHRISPVPGEEGLFPQRNKDGTFTLEQQ